MTNIKKYVNLVGSIITQFPLGVVYLSGNVSPYIISYLHSQGKYGSKDVGTEVWITSLFFAGMVASVITTFLEQNFGIRTTVIIGVIIVDLSYFLTYFSVQHSVWLVAITFGLIPGIGVAQAINATVSNVARWMPNKIGFSICLVVTGFGSGVIFINTVLTKYTNPLDLKTNISLGPVNVYSDIGIIERTPYMFLLLGCMATGIHVIGIPMIFEAPKDNKVGEYFNLEDNGKQSSTREIQRCQYSAYKMDLKEVVKQPAVYILTVVGFLYLSSTIVVLGAYKTFGESFIGNDIVLSEVGGIAALLGAVIRPCFGLLADKISHKWTIILMSGLASLFIETLYFTKHMGVIAYTVWLSVIFVLFGGAFSVFRSIIPRSFGIEHQSSNQVVLATGYSIAALVTGPVMTYILGNFGWFYLFAIIGMAPLIGMMIMCGFSLRLPDGSQV